MPSPQLHFHPIDLSRHGELAIEFRRDSYVCSFGDDQIFVEENGADGSGYLEWLRLRLAQFPEGHVHAWRGDEIVGQIEMMIGSRAGYINLFYLRPDARGFGLGDELHDYAVAVLLGYTSVDGRAECCRCHQASNPRIPARTTA